MDVEDKVQPLLRDVLAKLLPISELEASLTSVEAKKQLNYRYRRKNIKSLIRPNSKTKPSDKMILQQCETSPSQTNDSLPSTSRSSNSYKQKSKQGGICGSPWHQFTLETDIKPILEIFRIKQNAAKKVELCDSKGCHKFLLYLRVICWGALKKPGISTFPCGWKMFKIADVTFWVEHLIKILNKCCAQHRWDDAAKVVYAITHDSKYTSEIIWKAGFQILCNHPKSSPDLVKQFAMNVLQLKGVFQPAIMLDWIMYFFTRGNTSGAKEALQLNQSYRQERQMKSYTDKQKHIALILQGYEGTLLFGEWYEALQIEKNSNDEIEPNQQAMLDKNLHLEALANKALSVFQDLFLHEGNWDIFVTKYIDLMEYYNLHAQALNMLLHYCKLNPHNPNGYIFAHDYLKEHFPEQKSTLKFILKGLALICPSDKRVLDLPSLMSYQDNNVDLEAVFKLLDYEIWRNDPKPWKKLGSIIINMHRIPIQSEFEFLGRLWDDRTRWWPKYHFRLDQVTDLNETSAELLVNKALVVATLSGVDDPFVEKVRKVLSESPYSELLQALNHVELLLKRLDENSSGASDDESVYPDSIKSAVPNSKQLSGKRARNLFTKYVISSEQKKGVNESRNDKVGSLIRSKLRLSSSDSDESELDVINMSKESASHSPNTKASQESEHQQDYLSDKSNDDSSSSICNDITSTVDGYDTSSNTAITSIIHSGSSVKSVGSPKAAAIKSHSPSSAANSSNSAKLNNRPKLSKRLASITRIYPQHTKQTTKCVPDNKDSYDTKEAYPVAKTLMPANSNESVSDQQPANQDLGTAGDLNISDNNAPSSLKNQKISKLQNSTIYGEDMAINPNITGLYPNSNTSPSLQVHKTKRGKKNLCQKNSEDTKGGCQEEGNGLQDQITATASLEHEAFSDDVGCTKEHTTGNQKIFSTSVLNSSTPINSKMQTSVKNMCADVCMPAVARQILSEASPAIVQKMLKSPSSCSTIGNMMVSKQLNNLPNINKLSLKKWKQSTEQESKANSQPGMLDNVYKPQSSLSQKLFTDEDSCDITHRNEETVPHSLSIEVGSMNLPPDAFYKIQAFPSHTKKHHAVRNLPSPIPKSSSECGSGNCTLDDDNETNPSRQCNELKLNLTDSGSGDLTKNDNNCGSRVEALTSDNNVKSASSSGRDEHTLTQAVSAVTEVTFTDSETSDMVYDIAKVHAMLENDINEDSSLFKRPSSARNEKLVWDSAGCMMSPELPRVSAWGLLGKEKTILSVDEDHKMENICVIAGLKLPQKSESREDNLKQQCKGIENKQTISGNSKSCKEHRIEKSIKEPVKTSDCTLNHVSKHNGRLFQISDDTINGNDLVHYDDDVDFSTHQPKQNVNCNDSYGDLQTINKQLPSEAKSSTDLIAIKKIDKKAEKNKPFHKQEVKHCDEDDLPVTSVIRFGQDNTSSETHTSSTDGDSKHSVLGQTSETDNSEQSDNNSEPYTCSLSQDNSEMSSSKSEAVSEKSEKNNEKATIFLKKSKTNPSVINHNQNVLDNDAEKLNIDQANSSPGVNCWANAEFVTSEVSQQPFEVLDNDTVESTSATQTAKITNKGTQSDKNDTDKLGSTRLEQGCLAVLNNRSFLDDISNTEENLLSDKDTLNTSKLNRSQSESDGNCSELLLSRRKLKHGIKSKKILKKGKEGGLNNVNIHNKKHKQKFKNSEDSSIAATQKHNSDMANDNQDTIWSNGEVSTEMIEIMDNGLTDSLNVAKKRKDGFFRQQKKIKGNRGQKDTHTLVSKNLERNSEAVDVYSFSDGSNLEENLVLDNVSHKTISDVSSDLKAEENINVKSKNLMLRNINVEQQQTGDSDSANDISVNGKVPVFALQETNLKFVKPKKSVLPDETYRSDAKLTRGSERAATLQEENLINAQKFMPENAMISCVINYSSKGDLVANEMPKQVKLIENEGESPIVTKKPKKTREANLVKLQKDHSFCDNGNGLENSLEDAACGSEREKLTSKLTVTDDVMKLPVSRKSALVKSKAKKLVTANKERRLSDSITYKLSNKLKPKHKKNSNCNNDPVDEEYETVPMSPDNIEEETNTPFVRPKIIDLPEENCWLDAEIITQTMMNSGGNTEDSFLHEVNSKLAKAELSSNAFHKNLKGSAEGKNSKKVNIKDNGCTTTNASSAENEENATAIASGETKAYKQAQELCGTQLNKKHKIDIVPPISVDSKVKRIKKSKSIDSEHDKCARDIKVKKSLHGNQIEGYSLKMINHYTVKKAIESIMPGFHCVNDHPLQSNTLNEFSSSSHHQMTPLKINKIPEAGVNRKKKKKKTKSVTGDDDVPHSESYKPAEPQDKQPLLKKNKKITNDTNDSELEIALIKEYSAASIIKKGVLQLELQASEDLDIVHTLQNRKLMSKASPCSSASNVPLSNKKRALNRKENMSICNSSNLSFNISEFNSSTIINRLCIACARDLSFDKVPNEAENSFIENCWIDAELVMQAISNETNEVKNYKIRLDNENQQLVQRLGTPKNLLEMDIRDSSNMPAHKKRRVASDNYKCVTIPKLDYLRNDDIDTASAMDSSEKSIQHRHKRKAVNKNTFSEVSSTPYRTDTLQNDVSEYARKNVMGYFSKKRRTSVSMVKHELEKCDHPTKSPKVKQKTKTDASVAHSAEDAENTNEFEGIAASNGISEGTSLKQLKMKRSNKWTKSVKTNVQSSLIQSDEGKTQQRNRQEMSTTADSNLSKRAVMTAEHSSVFDIDLLVQPKKKKKPKPVVSTNQRSPVNCLYIDKISSIPRDSTAVTTALNCSKTEHKKWTVTPRITVEKHSLAINAKVNLGENCIRPKINKRRRKSSQSSAPNNMRSPNVRIECDEAVSILNNSTTNPLSLKRRKKLYKNANNYLLENSFDKTDVSQDGGECVTTFKHSNQRKHLSKKRVKR